MDPEILKKYGLPTALAVALLGSTLWLVNTIVSDNRAERALLIAQISALTNSIDRTGDALISLGKDVDFQSRIIDMRCQKEK